MEIAESGNPVYLVECDSTIGGQMAKFDKTFPSLDCSACILTPKMVSVSHRENIHLMTLSGLGRHFILDDLLSEESGYGFKAVFVATGAHKGFKLDVPGEDVSGVIAGMVDTISDIEVGQILVATGYQTFDAREMSQYGYGRYDNVLTSLEFERMLSSTGPTGGRVLCQNGKPPRAVGIIHCVGSRDEHHHRYCSRVCCMYALKFAHLATERTQAEVYQFYIDMRAFGKGYEEFYSRVLREGTTVIRGKGAEVVPARTDGKTEGNCGHLIIRCEDTLIGRYREIPVDVVVLCNAIEARSDAGHVAHLFSLSRSPDGFFLERHPKLDPVGTTMDGVYLAGACQGPKDIPDSVAQGRAAAARMLSLISKGETLIDPVRASIDHDLCSGCRICNNPCPYKAISFDEEEMVSTVNEVLCKGCGTCVAACPASAISGAGFTDEQVLAELEGVLV